MRLEELTHPRLQDRYVVFRVEAAPVHDADAPMSAVTAVVDEPPHPRARVRRRHAVQVAPVADDVLSALQFPDLAPIHTIRGEVIIWSIGVIGGRRGHWWCTDGWGRVRPPARISH